MNTNKFNIGDKLVSKRYAVSGMVVRIEYHQQYDMCDYDILCGENVEHISEMHLDYEMEA